MRVTVLLRYPRVERSAWKRRLVDALLEGGYDVSLVFGEASALRHARAALKQYGAGFLAKRRAIAGEKTGPASSPQPRLYEYVKAKGCGVYRVGDLNGPASVGTLRRLEPDLLVLLGTGIIRKDVLEVPRLGTVHCHQGYLPDYRGVNTIEWSIYHGDDVYITTHFVDPGIDTGRILYRERIPLLPHDDIGGVRDRCQQAAVPLLLRTIRDIREGTISPLSQGEAEGKQYFTMHPFFLEIVGRELSGHGSAA